MEVQWVVPEPWYHVNKIKFRQFREEYGILVAKKYPLFGWKSELEDVSVDKTADANGSEWVKIVWKGDKPTKLLRWMEKFFGEFASSNKNEKLKKFDEETQRQIKIWKESLNPPPEGYIKAYLKDRAEKRKQIENELA